MKRMLSGIKPTGQLTLGNYIGALRNFVNYQDDYEMYVFIANLHCVTVYQEPADLKKNLRDAVALYLAAGLDPEKSTIFLQSDVMEQAQLGWLLACNSYMGELNRMTQFKDHVAKGETNLTAGLYVYPCLMAADILAYNADYVPVGVDQKQHVELTRDIAIRFNNRYGDTFTVPEPLTQKVGAKIMSLSDPSKKMSKSDLTNKGCIYLLDEPKAALSPKGIIRLMQNMDDLVQNDSQFIISTHSPMLMAFPDAELYQIKENEIVSTPFKETDHYRITVRFLQNPEEAANEILGRDDP